VEVTNVGSWVVIRGSLLELRFEGRWAGKANEKLRSFWIPRRMKFGT